MINHATPKVVGGAILVEGGVELVGGGVVLVEGGVLVGGLMLVEGVVGTIMEGGTYPLAAGKTVVEVGVGVLVVLGEVNGYGWKDNHAYVY